MTAPTTSPTAPPAPVPTTLRPVTDRSPRAERAERSAELLARAADASGAERDRLLDEVVSLNVPMAHAVASRYRGRGIALDDLEQAACEGLVKAVRRFDVASGHALADFAVPTMRGEVLRWFRDAGWAVRPPRRVQELQARLRRTEDDLAAGLGREPTADEVCERLGVSRRDHDEARAALGCFTPASLDRPAGGVDEPGRTLGDSLPSDVDERSAAEARVVLGPVLAGLGARDRRVLQLRFVDGWTQREIGEELGVAQMHVSRVLARILGRMRTQLEADELPRSA